MGQFDEMVEQRIRNAMAEGHFDDLPGRGRPLVLDDVSLVPEELRSAYRVLKNAGYLPEALQLRSEIGDIERILETLVNARDRRRANKRLALLRIRLAACGGERAAHLDDAYGERIRRRLAGG